MIWETRAATIAVRNPDSMDSFDSAVNPCCTKSAQEPNQDETPSHLDRRAIQAVDLITVTALQGGGRPHMV
jgi:hypothetical protein